MYCEHKENSVRFKAYLKISKQHEVGQRYILVVCRCLCPTKALRFSLRRKQSVSFGMRSYREPPAKWRRRTRNGPNSDINDRNNSFYPMFTQESRPRCYSYFSDVCLPKHLNLAMTFWKNVNFSPVIILPTEMLSPLAGEQKFYHHMHTRPRETI